jgi:hypothetical protein
MSYSQAYRAGSLGADIVCPGGTYLVQNGAYQDCVVGTDPNAPKATAAAFKPVAIPSTLPMTATATPAAAAVGTPWGLIAALAVSGFVLYKFVL